MYTYFTREQLVAFAQTILPDFTESQLEEWEQSAPSILQPLPPIFGMVEATHLVVDGHWTPCTVHGIHIYRSETKYDLHLLLPDGEVQRIYNVSAGLIARPDWEKPVSQQLKDIWKP